MKAVTSKMFSRKLADENSNHLFVFGENKQQQSTSGPGGGQAVIRGCPNVFGFCTLESIGDYWTDLRYADNVTQIEKDIKDLNQKAKGYDVVVFPENGLGTGRAMMTVYAPKTFCYLTKRLLEEFSFNNIEHLQVPNY